MIHNISLFSGLSDNEIELIIDAAVVQKYPSKDNIIFHAGDTSDDLYIVKSGKINAVRYNNEYDQKIVVNSFGPGDFFGEMAGIDGQPRSATVETAEPSVVYKVAFKNIRKILAENPDTNFRLTKILLQKLRKATDQIDELVLCDVYVRLARFIGQLTDNQGPGSQTEKVTQNELAEHVGASREMVSRSISRLRQRKYIKVENKMIKVLKDLPTRY